MNDREKALTLAARILGVRVDTARFDSANERSLLVAAMREVWPDMRPTTRSDLYLTMFLAQEFDKEARKAGR